MLINNNNPTITMCINIVIAQSGGSCSATRTTDLDGHGHASSTTARTSGSASNSNTRATPLRGPGFSGFGFRLIPRERGTLRALRIPVASAPPTPTATAPLRRPGGNTDGQRHRLRRRAGQDFDCLLSAPGGAGLKTFNLHRRSRCAPAQTTPSFCEFVALCRDHSQVIG